MGPTNHLLPKDFDMSEAQTQIPVTVLTGYLGSGKTTLLNRILSRTMASAMPSSSTSSARSASTTT
jgi:tRNA A37 threonylcarbamoyladenosine biosynthesis protein TsaE